MKKYALMLVALSSQILFSMDPLPILLQEAQDRISTKYTEQKNLLPNITKRLQVLLNEFQENPTVNPQFFTVAEVNEVIKESKKSQKSPLLQKYESPTLDSNASLMAEKNKLIALCNLMGHYETELRIELELREMVAAQKTLPKQTESKG